MENIFQNYERQDFGKKEMIILLNSNSMNLQVWRQKAKNYKNVRVYKIPQKYKLGRCLNYGIRRAQHRIIAKFDDDDYYGPHYLNEAVKALSRKRVSIVGKHTSYVYFEAKRTLMLYRRGGERRLRNHVKGGTLVFRKSIWKKIKFNETLPRASDAEFLRRCRKAGYRVYSVSKHNYVCVRRKDTGSHTQKTRTKSYMAKCKLVRRTKNYIPYVTRTIR